MQWNLTGLDMEALIEVDWEVENEPLTKEQQSAYDRAIGALSATMKVVTERDRHRTSVSRRKH